MRIFKSGIFFLLGILLVSVPMFAFAQLHDWNGSRTSPGSIYKRGPNGLPFNVDTGRYVGVDSSSGGGAGLKGKYEGSIGGRGVSFDSTRGVSAAGLARMGGAMARLAGPASVAMMLAPLIWDELSKQFLVPDEMPYGVGDAERYWGPYGYNGTGRAYCEYPSSSPAAAAATCGASGGNPGSLGDLYYEQKGTRRWQVISGKGNPISTDLLYVFQQTECVYGGTKLGSGSYQGMCKMPVSCPEGQIYSELGVCFDPSNRRRPATEAEVDDAVLQELVSRGMGGELASRLVAAGYEPALLAEAGPISVSGPGSVAGPSSSTVSSGPGGMTTTTTTTNYDISYGGDTVTVTETSTTTITRPNGEVETSIQTNSPAPGVDGGGSEPPKEEQKAFCELYPLASACQELGEPTDEDLEEEERSLSWELPAVVTASCPAPIFFTSQSFGQTWEIEWEPVCSVAEAIKPVVVAVGLLSAAVFVFGIARARA